MTTLRFDGADRRDLLDTLIEAVRITDETGERPSIKVDGKVYAGHELVKVALLLSFDEPLQDHHAAKIADFFDWRQHGYGRTAYNLANRANQIASEHRRARSLASRSFHK